MRHPARTQKNVYSVFRYNPPSVGFAELSALANGSSDAAADVPSPTIGSVATALSAGSTSGAAPVAPATRWSALALTLVGAVLASSTL